MDLHDKLEIYIPAEAEVKSIPLRSLPNSVLRQMPDDTNSPKGIWICPAVVRKKGQKSTSHAENMLSLLAREFRATSGPFRMSFVSSNHTAYKVLKDTVPGSKAPPHLSYASSLPQGSASRTYQTAVVVYAGRIYLSIRKPRRSQRETREPQSAPRSSALSTARLSSKSQKKELLNDNKPKRKLTRCKITHSENKKGVQQKLKDVSSSKTARSESGDREMQDLGGEEAESVNRNNDMDGDVQIDSGEVDQSSTHSWIRREPLGAACASASLQNDFDFKELAQDEMISRMKARLRRNEAATNNFPST